MSADLTNSPQTIRIASRKSQLALVQTYWVQAELQKHFPDRTFEVEMMSTQGDKILDVPLAKIGDKGLFTKELEVKMLDRSADLAVHSLKDLPTNLPEGLMLGCITERENPADALVVNAKYAGSQLHTLPAGAVIGTSSLRRLAQLRHHFPHFVFKDVRGNVNTRLAKLDAGEYDALILAAAGLQRLDFGDRIHQVIPPELSLHAVGQGALGIECRTEDPEILALLQSLQHQPTAYRCYAERCGGISSQTVETGDLQLICIGNFFRTHVYLIAVRRRARRRARMELSNSSAAATPNCTIPKIQNTSIIEPLSYPCT